MTRDGVFFVTRMKTNTVYTTVEECAVPEKGNVLSDQIVSLPALDKARRGAGAVPADRILERGQAGNPGVLHQPSPLGGVDGGRNLQGALANGTVFQGAETKPKVKSFLGTSANAVKTQIWTALIAMLILKYLQMKSSFGWSLSNLAALVRQQLFIFRDLWAWLNNPMEGPPAARQLAEQLPMPLTW